MLRLEATLDDGRQDDAWRLLARPAEWSTWAPHLRGAWGLTGEDGEVAVGRRGAVRLLGAVPVPVAITSKRPGVAWSWRVGGVVDMDHRVEPGRVVIEVRAPRSVELALGATYGPLIDLLLRRLSRTASARPRPTRTGTPAG